MNNTLTNSTYSTEILLFNGTLNWNATLNYENTTTVRLTTPFSTKQTKTSTSVFTRNITNKSKTPTSTKNLLALLQLTISSSKSLSNESTTVKTGFRNNLNTLCSCDRAVPFSNKIYSQDDNIWKLAFFALAFIVGLISIMLILTFSTKILINRFQRKSDINSKKANGSKKPRKVSSISLLDFDAELVSNYASSIPNRKKRSLSSPSSTETRLKPENSSDSTDYSSQNLFNDLIKNSHQIESVSRQQSYIYGVTNKAFEEDIDKEIKCERIVSFRKQTTPSSFKPFNSEKKERFRYSQNNENEKCEKQILEQDAYLQPWKLPGMADEYEALEINPIIESAALSPATTFSECYSEKQNEANPSSYNVASTKIKDFSIMCMNNNELISKTNKITQELEKKLKERRQMMESKSDKFHHRLLDENDVQDMHHASSLSALEKRIQNWQNELNTKLSKKNSMTSNSSCVCPCHSHSCNGKNSFRNCEKRAHLERKESNKERDILHRTSFQNRQISKAKDKDKNYESNGKSKIPKIVIDNASSLPTKRESIRALMETKTVTQNKQKEVLEMHLNTLISSRRSTCKITE